MLHLLSPGTKLSYPGNEPLSDLLTVLLIGVDAVSGFCRQLQDLAFRKEK